MVKVVPPPPLRWPPPPWGPVFFFRRFRVRSSTGRSGCPTKKDADGVALGEGGPPRIRGVETPPLGSAMVLSRSALRYGCVPPLRLFSASSACGGGGGEERNADEEALDKKVGYTMGGWSAASLGGVPPCGRERPSWSRRGRGRGRDGKKEDAALVWGWCGSEGGGEHEASSLLPPRQRFHHGAGEAQREREATVVVLARAGRRERGRRGCLSFLCGRREGRGRGAVRGGEALLYVARGDRAKERHTPAVYRKRSQFIWQSGRTTTGWDDNDEEEEEKEEEKGSAERKGIHRPFRRDAWARRGGWRGRRVPCAASRKEREWEERVEVENGAPDEDV